MGTTSSIVSNNDNIDKNICISKTSQHFTIIKNNDKIKQYIIKYDDFYLLSIKNIDDKKIFVYVNDKLVHISKNNQFGYQLLKYVQISSDYSLITFPSDKIYVYDLRLMIQENLLKIVKTYDLLNGNHNINEQIIKTLLFDNSFYVLYANKIFCYNNNVKIFSHDSPTIKVGKNGNILLIDSKIQYINVQSNNRIDLFLSVLSPSLILFNNKNDCIFFINKNNHFCIYDIQDEKTIILSDENQNEKLQYNVIDYNHMSQLINNNIKLFVIIGWSNTHKQLSYWLLNHIDTKYLLSKEFKVDLSNVLFDSIEYINTNESMKIYQTNNNIVCYDIDKIIPIKFVEWMLSNEKNTIDKQKKYMILHNSINILAIDETIQEYKLTNFMKYILSLSNDESNNFLIRYNANIDICDSKSFNMFQDLLSNKHDDILSKIFSIKEFVSRNNTMIELLDHMYEYVKIIILNDKSKTVYLHEIKALYVCYCIMTLIMRYHAITNVLLQRSNRHNNIVNTFNNHFPIFSDFMNYVMQIY